MGTSSSSRPTILVILQSYENPAGTEIHTRNIVTGLSETFHFVCVVPSRGELLVYEDEKIVARFPVESVAWPVTPLRSMSVEQALLNILTRYQPKMVHIQHFFGWPLGVISQLCLEVRKVVISLHDMYALTPDYTGALVKDELQRLANFSIDECKALDDAYLNRMYAQSLLGSSDLSYLIRRREIIHKGLSDCAVRVCPSPFLQERIEQVLGVSCKVIEHGIDAVASSETSQNRDTFNVFYGGGTVSHKGYKTLLDAFSHAHRYQPNLRLHFYGVTVDELPSPRDDVTFHGSYRREDLPSILSTMDIAIIPSQFEESFSLLLSQCWSAHVYPVVSALGSLGRRVRDVHNGRVVDPFDAQRLGSIILDLTTDQSWRNFIAPAVRSMSSMLDEYRELYNRLLSN